MSARLTPEGEAIWQDLRQHMDWNEGFALVFLFAANIRLTDIFRSRLEQFFIGKTTRMQEIHYQPGQPDWLLQTMQSLLDRDEQYRVLHAPVWLALHHVQDEQALARYRQLLMRLNERRDVWRSVYPAPMILVLPEVLRPEIAALVPDLWSIRSLDEQLGDALLQSGAEHEPARSVAADALDSPRYFEIPATQQVILDEWQRLLQKATGAPERQYLLAGSRALAVYRQYGRLSEAGQVAETLLAWTRQLGEGDTPESLRDLSVSLDKVGAVAQQQGRWSDAQSAYEESLGLSRRLKALLGDTPESLRDLSVSLYKLALLQIAQQKVDCAMPMLQEGLVICERLATMQPDIPAYTEGVDFFSRILDRITEQSTA